MTTHTGSCQCGAVRYRAEIDLTKPVISCNCSMCGRAGSLLAFTTPDNFTLEQGEDNLTDYKFNKHVIHHVFCKTCGIKSFARGVGQTGPMIAINVRCLANVDLDKLDIQKVDGKSR